MFTDAPVALALPDLQGGVIFQRETPEEFGLQPTPIERLEAPGAAPEVIVDDPTARWIGAESVTTIDGSPAVLYRIGITLPNDCDPAGPPECRWDFDRDLLVAHDLAQGADTVLGMVGSFESDTISYSIGGEVTAFRTHPYGTPWSCVGVFDATFLLERDDSVRWVGTPTGEVRWLLHGSCSDVEPPECDGEGCELAHSVSTAPDGSSVAIVYMRSPFDPEVATEPLTLVIVDPTDAVRASSGRDRAARDSTVGARLRREECCGRPAGRGLQHRTGAPPRRAGRHHYRVRPR